jgi:hypothetical protein
MTLSVKQLWRTCYQSPPHFLLRHQNREHSMVIVSGFKSVGWFGSVGVSFVGDVGPREKWSSHLACRDTLPEMLPQARVGAETGHAWACPHRNTLSVASQGGIGCENFSLVQR